MKTGSSTPWGPAQTVTDLGRGIFSVSTAGHGGVFVPASLLSLIPTKEQAYAEKWSGSRSWFEEDCAAVIVFYRVDGLNLDYFGGMTREKIAGYYENVKRYFSGDS